MQKTRITLASFGTLSALALLWIALVVLMISLDSEYSSRPLEIKQRIWILWSLSSILAGLSIYLIIGYLKLFFSTYIPTKTHLLIGAVLFGICTLVSIWSAVVNGMLSWPWSNTPDILWSAASIACFGTSSVLHILPIKRHIQSGDGQ
jgi:hypothetical protein